MRVKFKFILAVLYSSFSLAAHGQSAEDLQRLEKFRKMVNMPVVYTVKSKGTVKVVKDLPYEDYANSAKDNTNSAKDNANAGKDSSNPGKMDIYEPPSVSRTKLLPVVLLVHGKTSIQTNPKEWGSYISWGNLLAREGFVTITFTHGLATPGASIESAGNDVLHAIAYIKQHAAAYHIDTSKISVIAFSAGVPLLSVLLREKVKGIVDMVAFYGFMDISATRLFAAEDKTTVNAYSLINYVDSSRPFLPFFIARAGLDSNPFLNGTIDAFVQKACQYNIQFTLSNHPTGVHGFDNQNDDARTKEIIEQMIVFLKSHAAVETRPT